MELRQLRYYVRLVELGSITRAAKDLNIVTSALSQQMSRLEAELNTRLLKRSATGVSATDAGLAFYRQAGSKRVFELPSGRRTPDQLARKRQP